MKSSQKMAYDTRVIGSVFSKSGIKLISHLPLLENNDPISVSQLAKKSKVPLPTAYKTIKKLSEWDNIVVTEEYTGRAPEFFYCIKTHSFKIIMNSNYEGSMFEYIYNNTRTTCPNCNKSLINHTHTMRNICQIQLNDEYK